MPTKTALQKLERIREEEEPKIRAIEEMTSVKITGAAAAAYSLSSTTTLRCLTCITQLGFQPRNKFNGISKRFITTISMASSHPLQVCVKSSVLTPNKLGDCPFCQRVLLTLEEKHLPYDMKLVDLTNKPEWFTKINPEGKVPVLKVDENWVPDSDVITKYLEEKYPNPPLASPPEKSTVGSKIFPAFVGFLKNKEPSDEKEQELLNELNSFNDYLKENGPFISGENICAADLSLGPKLYHMEIALGHYKRWSVPDSLSYVKSYMKSIFSRDSFVKTTASPEDVIAGWAKHMG
ncbi:glutathione S-transferase DHAR3, chloroplastic-like [Silene latifolia]|uniref:glutathione S-transferase DHAR3, chloroplastic-like n=1 Tax=Silene latifolia TaxID=37657 RepID=UPI003D76F286